MIELPLPISITIHTQESVNCHVDVLLSISCRTALNHFRLYIFFFTELKFVAGCLGAFHMSVSKMYANDIYPDMYSQQLMVFQLKSCSFIGQAAPFVYLQKDKQDSQFHSVILNIYIDINMDPRLKLTVVKEKISNHEYFHFPFNESHFCANGPNDMWISFESGFFEFGYGKYYDPNSRIAHYIFEDIIPSFRIFQHIFFQGGSFRFIEGKNTFSMPINC